ncbi:MAG: hypothetical protein AB7Q97_07090 [Gammaproteobacteria bacterium]
MPKTAVKIRIAAVKAFDSKFEAGAKKAALEGAEAAVKANSGFENADPKSGGWIIQLKGLVELDEKARQVVSSFKFDIFAVEKGKESLYNKLKLSKSATAAADCDPLNVRQAQVDDSAAASAEAQVRGILAKL